MIPEILMMRRSRRGKCFGKRTVCFLEMQEAERALAVVPRYEVSLMARLASKLAECEVAYLKATVEVVTLNNRYFRKELRLAKRSRQPASFVSSLQETLNHQKAVIAAAKAELKLRGIE